MRTRIEQKEIQKKKKLDFEWSRIEEKLSAANQYLESMQRHSACSGPVRGSSSRNILRKGLNMDFTSPGVLTGSREMLVLMENRRHLIMVSLGLTPAPF